MSKRTIKICGLMLILFGIVAEVFFNAGIVFISTFVSGIIVIVSTHLEFTINKDYHINMSNANEAKSKTNTERWDFAMNKKTTILLALCFALCCLSCFFLGGMMVSKGQAIPAMVQNTNVNVNSDKKESININTATLKMLQELSGIGEVKAKEIVKNRPYKSKQELVDKEIIGLKTYNIIQGAITVD